MITFKEKIDAFKEELEFRDLKYNRRKACTLIGFNGNSRDFSQWLKDNYFLTYDDYPEFSLIDRKYMVVKDKQIIKHPIYDCCSRIVSGIDGGEVIKTVYTPLFTEKGINFFKKLLQDKKLLHSEIAILKESYIHKPLKYDRK